MLLITSCTKDFEEINTNSNAPITAQPNLLLRQVIYNFGEQMSYEGFVAGDLLGQYRTALDFNNFGRHDLKSPQLGGNPWPIFYTNLRDNEILLKSAKTILANNVYKGPSLILKAYITAGLTDLFGNVPYTEAFNGVNGTATPAYNAQQSIYLDEGGILDNLEKGISAIENYTGVQPLEGDILYNGNLASWVKFANSLKIKYLMRISNKMDVSSNLQTIFAEGNYITSNTENAVFNFTNTDPNSFRLAQLRIGDFTNFVMSETMEDILNNYSDNRLEFYFRPFENSTTLEYNGLLNGLDASGTSISVANYSLAGTAFREDTSVLDANYATAWETALFLAEAAQKGYIIANAQDLYETGVTQAFNYWQTTIPTNYLTGNAAFNATGTSPLEQIITQKWIANMINGYEGWTEYRRTSFPELKTIQASLNNNLIPIRMPYPDEESALNAANYNQAAAATNNNSINAPVWWNE